jgi:hypothetical protein
MHYGPAGREPIHGLTFERPIPPNELARSQNRYLQTWAVGFYNAPGASIFARVWKDPNRPVWDTHVKYPSGTMIFKILFTTGTEDEVPTLKGAPTWKAVRHTPGLPRSTLIHMTQVIVPQMNPLDDPQPPFDQKPVIRNDFASDVRLIQMDFAVRDDRSPIGWVFGTFMYDGSRIDMDVRRLPHCPSERHPDHSSPSALVPPNTRRPHVGHVLLTFCHSRPRLTTPLQETTRR